MDLTLAHDDAGNVTATVSSSNGGTVTVYYVQVGTQWDSEKTWVSGGSRSGDGAVVIASGSGAFWFYALEDDGTVSPPRYIVAGNGRISRLLQIMDGIVARLRLLDLIDSQSGNPVVSGNIEHYLVLDSKVVEGLKGGDKFVVTPLGGESENTQPQPLQSDDIDYRIGIAQIAPGNRIQTTSLQQYWTLNRERIRQAFINQALSIDDGLIVRCSMGSLEPIQLQWWKDNKLVSPLQFTFTSRESRGIT